MKRTAKQIQGRPYVSPRTFFDNGSHEFTKKPFSYKTECLMEYVQSGYSLRRWIITYRNDYSSTGYLHMRGYLESTLNVYIDFFKKNTMCYMRWHTPHKKYDRKNGLRAIDAVYEWL